MSWGNPEFLHKIWSNVEQDIVPDEQPGLYSNGKGREDLKKAIKSLHKNTHGYKGNHGILIGNGATQVIQAIIYAISTISPAGTRTYAKIPYFSRFPSITMFGLSVWDKKLPVIEIVTSPNNPDGNHTEPLYSAPNIIYDYSYNWKQYTDNIEPLDKDIMVFSISKMSGHADMRIGWAFISDPEILELAERYIELNTAGVSKQSQQAATSVITTISRYHQAYFKGARAKLRERWDIINKSSFSFKILNNDGMFLYCQGECPKNVESINGLDFGDTTNKFRLNIGCSDETFNEFIRKHGNYGKPRTSLSRMQELRKKQIKNRGRKVP